MKYKVEVISGKENIEIEVEQSSNLLSLLQTNDCDIFAPCGGQGTCGKCKVLIREFGTVLSCQYTVEQDITVVLPEKQEMDVLVSQYNHTLTVPFIPDHTSMLGSYPLGLAIDLGTTTIAYYQVNLITGVLSGIRTAVNPQSKFGADVISRINYCSEHPDGLELQRKSIVEQINIFLNDFAKENFVTPDFFTKIVIAGNNTMLHLLSGTDPISLAFAPFAPQFTDRKMMSTEEMGLTCHKEAEISLLPSISAYVGADIVAGIASLSDEGENPYLFIDIGTNGEIALVSKEKIWCCATAAGPAFEGANISCGSGAVSGAINTFSGDDFTTVSKILPVSICGSGLIDIISYMLDRSLITEDGLLAKDFIVSPADKNGSAEDIIINQQDIREVQLAKGAIAAGISILLKSAGLTYDDISKIYVAGGFGNYMNMESAINIGLIPKEMRGKTELIGNAAGTGATLALQSASFIERMEQQRQKTEYIELSYDEDFPLEFALSMNFTKE